MVLEELWSRAHELPPPARDLLSRLVHLQTTLVGFRQEADHTEPELQVIEVGGVGGCMRGFAVCMHGRLGVVGGVRCECTGE